VRHGKTVNSKSSKPVAGSWQSDLTLLSCATPYYALKLRYSILPGWWDYLRKYQRSIEKKLGLHQ
jgi:hypothetical protein